ncbi:MAG: ATPase domain-containing protein [Desulfosoma sp.]
MKREETRVSTGIAGMDAILHGGFLNGFAYLVRGGPGTGKTTFGLHFLTAPQDRSETSLFITLSEPAEKIERVASAMGFDLSRVRMLDLSPGPDFFAKMESYDIFSPAEVEREPTTRRIIDTVLEVNPRRVFIDSMTQFRYLSSDPYMFRKQSLSFIRFLVDRGATVLFSSESSPEAPDEDLQFLCDGIIHLDFSKNTRTVRVSKFRGSSFDQGLHEIEITPSGMVVYPKLTPSLEGAAPVPELLSFGVPELDELLHGGLDKSSVTLIVGPTGVGKSTLSMAFAKEAAGRGERTYMYSFEEEPHRILQRCDAVNIPARAMVSRGTLAVEKVEPLRYSANAFAYKVLEDVEKAGTRIVIIDSVSGYRLCLRGSNLTEQLHALTRSLTHRGVTVLVIEEVTEITGEFRATKHGFSFLADNIVFIRYLEMMGRLKRAIGVLKKRTGSFEDTLREIAITRYGLKVGRPLTECRGVLRGVPEIVPVGSSGEVS